MATQKTELEEPLEVNQDRWITPSRSREHGCYSGDFLGMVINIFEHEAEFLLSDGESVKVPYHLIGPVVETQTSRIRQFNQAYLAWSESHFAMLSRPPLLDHEGRFISFIRYQGACIQVWRQTDDGIECIKEKLRIPFKHAQLVHHIDGMQKMFGADTEHGWLTPYQPPLEVAEALGW